MSVSSYINQLDKKYAWSLLGFLLAVIFGALSIYTEFIRDNHPQLRLEVVSDASVLDVREKLGNLAIMYDGVDIQKAEKSLRVIVFRIINDGAADILKGQYDEKAPFGFQVLNGSLVRSEIISSSNSYLKERLSIKPHGENSAVIDPVILESNESFMVKLLILHPVGTRPAVEPIGKIAGVRKIEMIDSTMVAAEPSYLAQTFSGTAWIQALRLVAYFLGFIAVIAITVSPVVLVSGALSKRQRKKHVAKFKTKTKILLNELDEFIFQSYINHDIGYLRSIRRATSNDGRLINEVKRYEKRMKFRQNQDGEGFMMTPTIVEGDRHILTSFLPIQAMQNSGLIVKDGNRWQVDPHAKETMEEFLRFLDIWQEE